MYNFCTYFDSNYLSRGLALYHSMLRHCADFHLTVMALDARVERALSSLNKLTVFPIENILTPELNKARSNRSQVEFYWSCTASFVVHCLRNKKDVTYIDADTYFFGSPASLFDEIGDSDIAITPHRFPDYLKWRDERNGKYNLGLAYFKNSVRSVECLSEWHAQCYEWCFNRYESVDKTCGEQGYMNRWPEKYGALAIRHLGVNLAPWNQMRYRYYIIGGAYTVNGQYPIVLYHFHGLTEKSLSGYPLREWVIQKLYAPYMGELRKYA